MHNQNSALAAETGTDAVVEAAVAPVAEASACSEVDDCAAAEAGTRAAIAAAPADLFDPDTFDPIAYINEPRWQASRLGLDRIRDLLDRLGRPQDALRFVHVAGTNGKGSTGAYLASILKEAGYTTGWFSSPYIERFEERIRVNGENISADNLRRVTLAVREQAEAISVETGDHPTEFELMTAVALLHFAQMECDIVVLEVGLGGRLDSTNAIDAPDVAVICRIGLDHTAWLGNTTAEVAAEKAGIIKPGSAVVSWPQDGPAMDVVRNAAAAARDALAVADFDQLVISPVRHRAAYEIAPGEPAVVRPFLYKGLPLETSLLGTYQPQNAALALEAIFALRERGFAIGVEAVREGIANTRWAGRFEVLPHITGKPCVVVDGGHNPQGAAVLAQSIADVFPGRKVVLLSGVMADKDYPAMLATVLPLAAGFVAVTPDNPRSLPAQKYADAAREMAAKLENMPDDLPIFAAETCAQAVARAEELAGADGIICAFGSLYSIHETKEALRAAGLL